MNPHPPRDTGDWAEDASDGEKEFRQAVHLILTAIESDPSLREIMVMKGGILMALRYRSPRFTRDIDFSTTRKLQEMDPADFRTRFEEALALAVAESDYDLDCRVQGCKILPPNKPDASFPSIQMKIGHAYKATPKHKKLLHGECPTIVSIDFSLNERILEEEELDTGAGRSILVYAFSDLVAEKLRSLLQQPSRDRFRRQDVYDLAVLLQRGVDGKESTAILRSLKAKSAARGLAPGPDSLSDPEIRRRAAMDYPTLADEVHGELPDFDASYDLIERFYRALPWEEDD